MFSNLLQIPLLYKLGALALLCIALVGYHKYTVHAAYNDGVTAAKTARQNTDNSALVAATQKADHDKAIYDHEMGKLTDERDKLKVQNEKYAIDLNARISSGAVRLRCPSGQPVYPNPTSESGPAPSGPAPAQGADLVPETAIAFVDVARGSAKDVRDYNDVVAAFNACRALNNGK